MRKPNEDRRCWYPTIKDTSSLFSLKPLLKNLDDSDVVLSIGEAQEKFPTHKCVLFLRAPGLHQLLNEVAQGGEDFEFPDVQVSTFKSVLDYIYAGNLPDTEDEDNAKTLLDLANRFGCVDLKLWLESEITSKMVKASNAADWLLVADSKVCPLLKEKCMNVCKDNFDVVRATSGWKNMRESPDLLEELIGYCTSTTNPSTEMIDFDDYERMDVGTLRNMLQGYMAHAVGNDMLDGTKKMLIEKLKEEKESFIKK